MTYPSHPFCWDPEILRVWATNPVYRDLHPAPRAALAPFPPPPRRRHGAGGALRRTVRHALARPRAGRAPTPLRAPRAEEGRT